MIKWAILLNYQGSRFTQFLADIVSKSHCHSFRNNDSFNTFISCLPLFWRDGISCHSPKSPNHDNRYVCLNIFIYLLGRHNLEMQFNKNKETPYKATYLYFIIYFLNSEQSGTLVMWPSRVAYPMAAFLVAVFLSTREAWVVHIKQSPVVHQ